MSTQVTEVVTGTISGSGTLTLSLRQVRFGKKRQYISVHTELDTGEASLGGVAKITRSGNTITATNVPWQNTAYDDGQMVLFAPEQLKIEFEGCSSGAVATVTAVYTE